MIGRNKQKPAENVEPTTPEEKAVRDSGDIFVYASDLAEQFRDMIIEKCLECEERGIEIAYDLIDRNEAGRHEAAKMSFTKTIAELKRPFAKTRERMKAERMEAPEVVAKRYVSPNVTALPPRQGVTLQPMEGTEDDPPPVAAKAKK